MDIMKIQELRGGELVDVKTKVTLLHPMYDDLTWEEGENLHEAGWWNTRGYKKAIIIARTPAYKKAIVSVFTGAMWAIFQADLEEGE